MVSLTYFPVDMILGILLGESYSGIRALADLSMCVKYTNTYLSGTYDPHSKHETDRMNSWTTNTPS